MVVVVSGRIRVAAALALSSASAPFDDDESAPTPAASEVESESASGWAEEGWPALEAAFRDLGREAVSALVAAVDSSGARAPSEEGTVGAGGGVVTRVVDSEDTRPWTVPVAVSSMESFSTPT